MPCKEEEGEANNSDVKILLDQTKFKDRYNDIAAILGLTAIQLVAKFK